MEKEKSSKFVEEVWTAVDEKDDKTFFSISKKIKEVTKVVKMFKNHLSGVINTLITKYSNAMAERLNGKIQEIKSIGKGYRTFKNFRSVILFFYGGLNLYPLK